MTADRKKTEHIDPVEEADIESFPPAWTLSRDVDEDSDESEDRSKTRPSDSRQ